MAHTPGWYARFFAWFMSRAYGGRYGRVIGERKRPLLEELTGIVVEIGAGTGPNLALLPPDLQVVGVEPNPFMHRYFLKSVGESGRAAALVRARAEALPFADGSVDAVLSTLVLCSVASVGTALAEVLRVLRPGGRFLFLEHVAAPEGTRLLRVQQWVRPLWRLAGDGCEPDRRTEEELRRAGFREVSVERFQAPVPLVSPHIVGVAVK